MYIYINCNYSINLEIATDVTPQKTIEMYVIFVYSETMFEMLSKMDINSYYENRERLAIENYDTVEVIAVEATPGTVRNNHINSKIDSSKWKLSGIVIFAEPYTTRINKPIVISHPKYISEITLHVSSKGIYVKHFNDN